jgi:hypothetical protein
MVDCFNELLTQSNSAPTYRNRYFARFIGNIHVVSLARHIDICRTRAATRMQTRVAIGGTTNAPARHTDPCHICCNEMFSCNEIRAAGSSPVGSTMKRTRDFNRSATSPPTRARVARPDQSRNDSCVITLTLPTKPANAHAALAIRGQADPERIRPIILEDGRGVVGHR